MLLTVSSLRLRLRKVDSHPSVLDLGGKRNHALQVIYKNLGHFSLIAKIRNRVYQIPQARRLAQWCFRFLTNWTAALLVRIAGQRMVFKSKSLRFFFRDAPVGFKDTIKSRGCGGHVPTC